MTEFQNHNHYQRKIKTREELRAIIGARPRARKVIMCHGTFDLVHPGHIRHLMYAKSKADLLIVSLTSDAYIAKANFRPFVPQDLRAMNLAALEVVDFVIVDDRPTPLENLLYLQPDYFAKGQDYSKDGKPHPRTREEMDALATYGGDMIFTPGDVVFSSSAFIEQARPNLSLEKALTLMESEDVTFDAMREALEAFKGVRVHVVGDTIVDTYTYCTLIGGLAKTPTFSVKYERQVHYAGGAAVVAKHLRKAGANVTFSTVLGDDPLKAFVLNDLEASGITCRASIDPTRPTTQKNVITVGSYRMLKVDTLDNRAVSDKILDQLRASLVKDRGDAYVFSDFRHGIFSRQTIPTLVQAVPAGALRIADSQVASRWGNILDFQGFDLITPNEREARFALGDQDTVIRPLAMELYKLARCKLLLLKMGDRGVLAYRASNDDVRSFFTVDSFAHRVVDAVGAGDALLAYATLALAAKKSPVIASLLGSMAAAVACEHEGNVPVDPEDILKKLEEIEGSVRYA